MEPSEGKRVGKRNDGDEDEVAKTMVFSQLKPLCTQLFGLLGKSGHDKASLLHSLTAYVREASPVGLQACLDYILFPLLLLLDASIACRSSKTDSAESPRREGTPLMISDRVAEGVLSCLEEVLLQCSLTSTDQMAMLLRKLTCGALLSTSEASEEFHHGVIKCLRAVLLGLKPCSNEACTCKLIPGSTFFISNIESLLQTKDSLIGDSQTQTISNGGCLIAFLQSEDASPAVGHLLSLLLQIAEAEGARGHLGSGKLRIDALSTLRILIAKVGTADALAFFLPGVTSGLAKVLRVSKFMIGDSFQVTSGAAGSTGAIEQAIKGLAEILVLTCADQKNSELYTEGSLGPLSSKPKSVESALEALRCLSVQIHAQKEQQVAKEVPGHYNLRTSDDSNGKTVGQNTQQISEIREGRKGAQGSYFRADRNKEWFEQTAQHVNCILSATFPMLCAHPARAVRLGLAEATGGLLIMCNNTLRRSKPMLLECLFALACDECETAASAAYGCLSILFSSDGKYLQENELNDTFRRLIDRLPKAILGGDETSALIHARRLVAAMYFAGPQGVSRHLFASPAAMGRFLEVMTQSVSHTSAFTGPIEQLVPPKTHSTGYLKAISDLTSDITMKENEGSLSNSSMNSDAQILQSEGLKLSKLMKAVSVDDSLPCMPPWFSHAGGHKLYQVLTAIIRLASLSTAAGPVDELSLSILIELPLESLRHTISELRLKEYREEDWYAWYNRHGSGRLLRDAGTAVCVLNEIIYGASGRSMYTYVNLFEGSKRLQETITGKMAGTSNEDKSVLNNDLLKTILDPLKKWEISQGMSISQHVRECVRNILHEYMSSEIWDLPIDFSSTGLRQGSDNQELPWHFFQDTAMLQQVIVEGVGVFGISLGKDFETSGFLYSSLYLLLEKLACSNYHIRSAADVALRMFSASAGYHSVKDLVVANIDYIIDSLCRQLRHLTLNPHAPHLLAAILSSIGAAHEVLPLLEEPIRYISLELEVLARHEHPNLTIPILKALREILKASRQETRSITQEALAYSLHIKSEVESLKEKDEKHQSGSSNLSLGSHNKGTDTFLSQDCNGDTKRESIKGDASLEHWEQVLLVLDRRKKYRQSVATIVGSCLMASVPLVGSKEQEACLISLDVLEIGIGTLAMIEEAIRDETGSREAIDWVANEFSLNTLQDTINPVQVGNDGNKLLPTMNKIWPYLVVCLKHTQPPVVVRCLSVIANVVLDCGGNFFIRRFYNDGPHFFRLLSAGPCLSRYELVAEKSVLLPFRKGSKPTDREDMAQGSLLKVQEALFKMIATIAKCKKSSPALEAIFNQVAGLAVGFSCGYLALQQAATDALLGLACIDPDLVWLLLADLAYSMHGKQAPCLPGPEFPELSQLFPPHQSSKQYLWMQYAGQDYGLTVDFSQACRLLEKIDSFHQADVS